MRVEGAELAGDASAASGWCKSRSRRIIRSPVATTSSRLDAVDEQAFESGHRFRLALALRQGDPGAEFGQGQTLGVDRGESGRLRSASSYSLVLSRVLANSKIMSGLAASVSAARAVCSRASAIAPVASKVRASSSWTFGEWGSSTRSSLRSGSPGPGVPVPGQA